MNTLDIVRDPAGNRRRIETEHQRDRDVGRAQPLRDRDRGIRAGRMADQHHRRRRAAMLGDDLAREIAGRVHAVHAGIDAALPDPRRQIVEAGREHLADQTAQQIDVARNAARGRARRGGGDLVDDRAAASGERDQHQPEKRGEDRGDSIRTPAHPRFMLVAAGGRSYPDSAGAHRGATPRIAWS